MITIKIAIDAKTYRQHLEQAEGTDEEGAAYLRQDIMQRIQTFRHYDLIIDAIRNRKSVYFDIFLQDAYVELPEEEETGNHLHRRHYEQEAVKLTV